MAVESEALDGLPLLFWPLLAAAPIALARKQVSIVPSSAPLSPAPAALPPAAVKATVAAQKTLETLKPLVAVAELPQAGPVAEPLARQAQLILAPSKSAQVSKAVADAVAAGKSVSTTPLSAAAHKLVPATVAQKKAAVAQKTARASVSKETLKRKDKAEKALVDKIKSLKKAGLSKAEVEKRVAAAIQTLPGADIAMRAAEEIKKYGKMMPNTQAALIKAQKEFMANNPGFKKGLDAAAKPLTDALKGVTKELDDLSKKIPGTPEQKKQVVAALSTIAQGGKFDAKTLQKIATKTGEEMLKEYGKKYGEKALKELLQRIPKLDIPGGAAVTAVANAAVNQIVTGLKQGKFDAESIGKAALESGKDYAIEQAKKIAIEKGTELATQAAAAAGSAALGTAASYIPYVGIIVNVVMSSGLLDSARSGCVFLTWDDLIGPDPRYRAGGYAKGYLEWRGKDKIVSAFSRRSQYACNKCTQLRGVPDPRYNISLNVPKALEWMRKRHKDLAKYRHAITNSIGAEYVAAEKEARRIRGLFPKGPEGLDLALQYAKFFKDLWYNRTKGGSEPQGVKVFYIPFRPATVTPEAWSKTPGVKAFNIPPNISAKKHGTKANVMRGAEYEKANRIYLGLQDAKDHKDYDYKRKHIELTHGFSPKIQTQTWGRSIPLADDISDCELVKFYFTELACRENERACIEATACREAQQPSVLEAGITTVGGFVAGGPVGMVASMVAYVAGYAVKEGKLTQAEADAKARKAVMAQLTVNGVVGGAIKPIDYEEIFCNAPQRALEARKQEYKAVAQKALEARKQAFKKQAQRAVVGRKAVAPTLTH